MRRRMSSVSPSFGRQICNLHPIEEEPGVQQSGEQERQVQSEKEHGGDEMEDLTNKDEIVDTDTRPAWEKLGMARAEYKGQGNGEFS